MDHIAFPQFVDLSQYSIEQAVMRVGKKLPQLTLGWR
jgi:hypothetical protein